MVELTYFGSDLAHNRVGNILKQSVVTYCNLFTKVIVSSISDSYEFEIWVAQILNLQIMRLHLFESV